jgi:hypothetical protein
MLMLLSFEDGGRATVPVRVKYRYGALPHGTVHPYRTRMYGRMRYKYPVPVLVLTRCGTV